jgi:hypothetical protein
VIRDFDSQAELEARRDEHSDARGEIWQRVRARVRAQALAQAGAQPPCRSRRGERCMLAEAGLVHCSDGDVRASRRLDDMDAVAFHPTSRADVYAPVEPLVELDLASHRNAERQRAAFGSDTSGVVAGAPSMPDALTAELVIFPLVLVALVALASLALALTRRQRRRPRAQQISHLTA